MSASQILQLVKYSYESGVTLALLHRHTTRVSTCSTKVIFWHFGYFIISSTVVRATLNIALFLLYGQIEYVDI